MRACGHYGALGHLALPMHLPALMKHSTAKMERGKAVMQHDFDVLIDSDAFVGWLLPNDAHFANVSSIFANLEKTAQKLVTTSWVIAETATVLSVRDGQETARRFLQQVHAIQLPIIHISEELQEATTKLFI